MNKPKEYKISTLEDIENAVTPENIDNFLVDFEKYLHIHISMKKLAKATGEIAKITHRFTWIDDGKNETNITVKVTNK